MKYKIMAIICIVLTSTSVRPQVNLQPGLALINFSSDTIPVTVNVVDMSSKLHKPLTKVYTLKPFSGYARKTWGGSDKVPYTIGLNMGTEFNSHWVEFKSFGIFGKTYTMSNYFPAPGGTILADIHITINGKTRADSITFEVGERYKIPAQVKTVKK